MKRMFLLFLIVIIGLATTNCRVVFDEAHADPQQDRVVYVERESVENNGVAEYKYFKCVDPQCSVAMHPIPDGYSPSQFSFTTLHTEVGYQGGNKVNFISRPNGLGGNGTVHKPNYPDDEDESATPIWARGMGSGGYVDGGNK